MSELRFHVEWDEAPGVTETELARTWGQLQILVADVPVTKFYNTRTQSVRAGTYGSVLPLATWLLDRWWFLLSEGTPSSRIFEGGRRALAESGDGELLDWLRRHNLLTAREGFALPDLSIFRDEAGIQLRWVPDVVETSQPGRFVEDGRAVISEKGFISAVTQLVESVAERLDDRETAKQLRAELVGRLVLSGADSAAQHRGLAALGLDPEADLSDEPELRDALLVGVPSLPELLQRDVLEAHGDDLAAELAWVGELRAHAKNLGSNERRLLVASAGDSPIPHVAGYQRARATRRLLSLPATEPLTDLENTIGSATGPIQQVELEHRGRSVSALVTYGARDNCVLVGARSMTEHARRFRLARALHHWLYAPGVSQGRLLTNAHAWNQRASRAFAAEFLAPADGIRERLEASEDDEFDLRSVAQEFRVSEQVIQFQVVNHDL